MANTMTILCNSCNSPCDETTMHPNEARAGSATRKVSMQNATTECKFCHLKSELQNQFKALNTAMKTLTKDAGTWKKEMKLVKTKLETAKEESLQLNEKIELLKGTLMEQKVKHTVQQVTIDSLFASNLELSEKIQSTANSENILDPQSNVSSAQAGNKEATQSTKVNKKTTNNKQNTITFSTIVTKTDTLS